MHDLRAFGRRSGHLKHHEFAFGGLAIRKLGDLNHIDQLIDLFNCLIQRIPIANDHRSNAGDIVIAHRSYVEGFDIETAPAEHPSDPGEDTELVFNEDREISIKKRAFTAHRKYGLLAGCFSEMVDGEAEPTTPSV